VAATHAFVAAHLALAGLAAYALARGLGLTVAGGLVAAVAYEFSALFERARCCPVYAQLAAWLPLVLLGAELAIRAQSWRGRVGGWGLTGFALSQVLASWLGQGAAYVLLALGGYVAYRTLLDPPRPASPLARLAGLLLHGAAVTVVGFGLGAAGVLPRLEFNALSTLAGGVYRGHAAWAAEVGGWTPKELAEHLLASRPEQRGWYAGGATLALAVAAPLLARRAFAVPYFAALALIAILLTARPGESTPLHAALYGALPRFAALHQHWPERVTVVFYLGPALLAGAAASALPRWRRHPGGLAAAAAVPFLGAVLLVPLVRGRGVAIAPAMLQAFVAACLLVAGSALLPWPRARRRWWPGPRAGAGTGAPEGRSPGSSAALP